MLFRGIQNIPTNRRIFFYAVPNVASRFQTVTKSSTFRRFPSKISFRRWFTIDRPAKADRRPKYSVRRNAMRRGSGVKSMPRASRNFQPKY